jgi:hypothetical protein
MKDWQKAAEPEEKTSNQSNALPNPPVSTVTISYIAVIQEIKGKTANESLRLRYKPSS